MDMGKIELVHAIPGRIRLRVPEIKGKPDLTGALQKQLSGFRVVRRVEVNPITGSVLVLYDPADTAAIVELGRALFPGLDRFGSANPLPDSAGAEAEPSLEEGLADAVRDLNARVESTTGGADLKVLLPLALLLFGIKGLLLGKKVPSPSWYDYLWFAFGTYFTLNRPPAPRGQAPVEPGVVVSTNGRI